MCATGLSEFNHWSCYYTGCIGGGKTSTYHLGTFLRHSLSRQKKWNCWERPTYTYIKQKTGPAGFSVTLEHSTLRIGFCLSWPDNAAHSICIMVSSSTRPNRHYLKCTNHQVGFLVVAANKPQISITPIRVRFLRWSLSFWSILFCRQIWGVHRVPLSKIKRTSIIRSLMYKRQT